MMPWTIFVLQDSIKCVDGFLGLEQTWTRCTRAVPITYSGPLFVGAVGLAGTDKLLVRLQTETISVVVWLAEGK